MNRSNFVNGPRLAVAALLLAAQTGCQQTPRNITPGTPVAATSRTAAAPDPADPTAWSGKVLTRDDPGTDSTRSGLPKGSGGSGTWSNEAQDIEKSLGFGR